MKWFLILSVLLCISCTKANNNNQENMNIGSTLTKEKIEQMANENTPLAQYAMGGLYRTGEMGTEIDYKKSFEWYMKSAQQGNAKAQFWVSVFF